MSANLLDAGSCGEEGTMLSSMTSLLLGGAYRLSDVGIQQVTLTNAGSRMHMLSDASS